MAVRSRHITAPDSPEPTATLWALRARLWLRGAPDRPNGARGIRALRPRPPQTCRRAVMTRNRLATNAESAYAALAAGLAPVPWKSLNAAVWLTKI